MRLTYLCDMEMAFEDAPILVRPYGGEGGVAFGQGRGTIAGERLHGVARWVNHPRRRNDGAMLPDIRGVITTGDGATILFSMDGRTIWVDTPNGRLGNQLLRVLFEAEDERYRWLNDIVCVSEGAVDLQGGRMPRQVGHFRVYVCVNETL